MKTKTIEVYEFEELSDDVKEKLIDNHRQHNLDYDWYNFLLEDFIQEVKEEMGIDIEIKDIEFNLYKPFISIASGVIIKQLCYKFNDNGLIDIDIPNKFGIYTNYLGGGLCSGFCRSEINNDICIFEEEYDDDDDLKEIVRRREERKIQQEVNNKVIEILEKLQDKMNNLLNNLNEEYNYLQSDEYIIEYFKNNEHEFDKFGDIV